MKQLSAGRIALMRGNLAKKLNVPCTRIERIAAEQTPITTDTALRLAKYFRTTPEFWMNLQTSFNLKAEEIALHRELELIPEIDRAA
ncbi:HigA family addiction module antitoxin [Ensifer aridi]|uniref:HigA family addiction module antitoxin n=1 Tax=Ensifer aridi TaxID=1708715 RepID=UPI001FCD8CA2|nr:HigA family addiction module antitoxin [Ensifer aridi]